jgi:hypothetical protein
MPRLEVCDWPRYEQARQRHEAAIEVLVSSQATGDAEEFEQAMLGVCDATDQAVEDLLGFDHEAIEARAEAVPTVEPKAWGGEPGGGPEDLEDLNARTDQEIAQRRAEQRELAPRREALERDLIVLRRARMLVEPNMLDRFGFNPEALVQARRERAKIEKTIERRAALADETLEDRVERLEGELAARA